MNAVDRHRKDFETGFPQFAVISFSWAFFHSLCFIISFLSAQSALHGKTTATNTRILTRIRLTFMLSTNRISVLFIVLCSCRCLFSDDALDFQCSGNIPPNKRQIESVTDFLFAHASAAVAKNLRFNCNLFLQIPCNGRTFIGNPKRQTENDWVRSLDLVCIVRSAASQSDGADADGTGSVSFEEAKT